MKRIIVGEPVVVSQSTTEPIRHGGWQDPSIRCCDGVLYVRFSGCKDLFVNDNRDMKDPLFCSEDGGKSWKQISMPAEGWTKVQKPLINGDRVAFTGRELIMDTSAFPPVAPERVNVIKAPNSRSIYTHEEFKSVVEDADYGLYCHRIDGKTGEYTKEKCLVRFGRQGHGLVIHGNCIGYGFYVCGEYREDKDGTIYVPASGAYFKESGELASPYSCLYILKSTDHGKSFDFVGAVDYLEEYNAPNAFEIEGFMEGNLEIADDGSFFTIMRSGSLSPYIRGSKDKPAPKSFIARSYDKGKTWTKPEVFYDYGVLPRSTRLGNGAFIMTSGRPDVYIRACYDGLGKEWDEVIHVLEVPEKDIYNAYEQYTCSNNGICAYDENTAYLTYSNFQLTTPEGERAKSIIVRKISVVEE